MDETTGWEIVQAHTPNGIQAVTDWEARTVTIDPRLTRAEARLALAHELLHIERGQVPAWQVAREESTIEAILARRLIALGPLIDALKWSTDPREVAETLEVDADLLWRRFDILTIEEREQIERELAWLL